MFGYILGTIIIVELIIIAMIIITIFKGDEDEQESSINRRNIESGRSS